MANPIKISETVKIYLSIIAFLIFLSSVYGQGIGESLAKYEDETSIIIKNGRAKIGKSLVKNDTIGLRQLVRFLADSLDEDYIGLYPTDKLFLGYITGDYRLVDDYVLHTDSILNLNAGNYILPEQDNLADHILTYCLEQYEGLNLSIEMTFQGYPESQDFHFMNLLFFLNVHSSEETDHNAMNELSERFIELYPESHYQTFTKSYINQQYELKPYAFSTGLAFFTGATFFGEDLGSRLKPGIPLSWVVSYHHNRWIVDGLLSISLSGPREPFEQDGVLWKTGDQANNYVFGFSGGYKLIDSESWTFYPFVGFGTTEISPAPVPVEENPEYKDVSIGFSGYYSAGFNLNYNFKNIDNPYNPTINSHWYVGLRFEYLNPQFENKEEEIKNASIYNVALYIGMFNQRKKKKYSYPD